MTRLTYDGIKALDKEQFQQLWLGMAFDAALYADVMMVDNPKWSTIPDFHRIEYQLHDDLSLKKLSRGCIVEWRGAAKSTKKCLATSRDLAYGHEDVVVYTSESEGQALDDIEFNKAIVESRTYQLFYGDHKGKCWNQDECVINGRYLRGVGFKTRIRGIKSTIDGALVRPTKVVADDFESEHNTATEEMRQTVNKRILSEIEPMGEAQNFRLLFEGTVVHPQSYLAKAKDNPIYKTVNGGKYLEFQLSSDPYNIGIPTWPEKFPYEEIEKIKLKYCGEDGKDIWQFYQEYYNIPMITGKPKFDTDQIKPITATFDKYQHLTWLEYGGKKVPINVFIGVDPASSLKKKADNTWVVTIAMTPSGDWIILDLFWDKIHMPEQITTIAEKANLFYPRLITVETFGYQGELLHMYDLHQKANGMGYSTKNFQEGIGKSRKFKEGLCVDINAGKIMYLDTIPAATINKMLTEMRMFTGTQSEKDDSIDGLYLAKINSFAPMMFDVDEELRKIRLKEGQYELFNNWASFVQKSNVGNARKWRTR